MNQNVDIKSLYNKINNLYKIKQNKVILYGCGHWGLCMYHMLQYVGMKTSFFCDSNPVKWGQEILKTKVLSPEQLKYLDEDTVIIITVLDDMHANEISDILNKMKLKTSKIFRIFNIDDVFIPYWKKQMECDLAKIKTKLDLIDIKPILSGGVDISSEKFQVTDYNSTKYFLRIVPIIYFEQYKYLANKISLMVDNGIPTPNLLDMGTEGSCIYLKYDWANGDNLMNYIQEAPEPLQYNLGMQAGEILRRIHSVHSNTHVNNCISFSSHLAKQHFEAINALDGSEMIVSYIEKNKHLLEEQEKCILHGDFGMHNIMIQNMELKIIDFLHYYTNGDKYIDFRYLFESAQGYSFWVNGIIKGYFNNELPNKFWESLLLSCCIRIVEVSFHFSQLADGGEAMESLQQGLYYVLECTANLTNPVPTWYLAGRRGISRNGK